MTSAFDKLIPQTRRAFGLGLLLALVVLAATVLAGALYVRGLVRDQMARRDGEALYATTLMEQLDDASPDGIEARTDEQIGFDAAVRASRLKGVIGIRFYDISGTFTDAFPATILPLPVGEKTMNAVRAFKPHSRLLPDTPLSTVFIYLPQFAEGRVSRVPILEVTVPLHRRDTETLAGAAQFIIEGESMALEYAQLDRRLTAIALITFTVAGLLLAAMLWPAFRRLEKLNVDLAVRSERLQRANEELLLAARASAIGAVSAHLMHGLKNPLASLSQFVSSHSDTDSAPDEWQDALTASRRMQALVEHTLEVLADAQGEPAYELSLAELTELMRDRIADAAAGRNVKLAVEVQGECVLSSRNANLAGLILVNLLENAVAATPPGGTVTLTARREDGLLSFRVCDEGPGFPAPLLDHLFLPCKSTREGGSGLGLAISKQISDYLGAELELETTSDKGCVFRLDLPL